MSLKETVGFNDKEKVPDSNTIKIAEICKIPFFQPIKETVGKIALKPKYEKDKKGK